MSADELICRIDCKLALADNAEFARLVVALRDMIVARADERIAGLKKPALAVDAFGLLRDARELDALLEGRGGWS